MFEANASIFSKRLGHIQDIRKVVPTYNEALTLTHRWAAYATFLELNVNTWLVELDSEGKPVK